MKAILTYALFLIGIFAFSYMLIVSADSEAQIQDNREKAHQEYIQKDSLKWKLKKDKKMKKTFRLHFVRTECYYADVEADSLQEAIDKAEDIESGQMEAIDDTLHFEFDEDFTKRTNTNKEMR